MKQGSLISTRYKTQHFLIDATRGRYCFTTSPPVPDEVYLCNGVYKLSNGADAIDIEEIGVRPINGHKSAHLYACYWFEVSPPIDLEALLSFEKSEVLV